MTQTKKIAALALAGAVAFSPLFALADDSVDVHVDTEASTSGSRSLMENIKLHVGAHASTTASTSRKEDREQKQEDQQAKHEQQRQDRGEKLVDNRISILQKLEARINDMKRLTADQKSAIVADLTAQINALTSLRTQIASDASTTTLIADLKAIRPDYRTYLLVMPRTALIAAADRVMDITTQMTAEGTKLQARITDAQHAGADVSAAQSAYADYQAKVSDAKVQAQAAIDLVSKLNVDKSDATTMAANTAALKAARTKLQAARTDLKDARQDMAKIMQAVKGKGSVTASTTASTHD